MALQRALIAGTRNATTGFTSSNALASTTQTPTIVALASSITVGTANNVVDHQVVVTANIGAITPSASTLVNVFAYGSTDGTTWPGSAAAAELVNGTDKTLTQSTNGNNMRYLGSIVCHTASTAIASEPLSIASAFAGAMPAAYQVVIQNATTLALTASGASVIAEEIYYT